MQGAQHCLFLNDNHTSEVRASTPPVIGKPKTGKGVILILGQNSRSDKTYGRDAVGGLMHTLE